MSVQQVRYATEVAEATEAALIPVTKALKHAYENTSKHGIPMIAVSPAQGKFLSLLTRISSAKNVLELGTLGGYSTIWFAEALKKGKRGGKVTSIEIDASRRDVALQNLEVAGISVPSQAEIVLGAGLDVLPKLAEEIAAGKREKFDFIFIDADWDNQWAYFDWAVKLSNGSGSVIYVDNVVRVLLEIGAVGPEKRDPSIANLVEKVGADDRVDAVVMQTVGSKDYDGFLLAVVT
jgi:predicted O-methyltransferase YrrM